MVVRQVCVVCMEEIDRECRIDGCDHVYHLICIKKWVQENENSCPQCKVAVKKLNYKDEEGLE